VAVWVPPTAGFGRSPTSTALLKALEDRLHVLAARFLADDAAPVARIPPSAPAPGADSHR
jgi:hypothetical protein